MSAVKCDFNSMINTDIYKVRMRSRMLI